MKADLHKDIDLVRDSARITRAMRRAVRAALGARAGKTNGSRRRGAKAIRRSAGRKRG